MMGNGVMLRMIIGPVEAAFAPEDVELALADAVAKPIVPHVNGLGPFLLHGVVGDADGGAVVRDDGSWRLGVAKFLEAGDLGAGFLTIVVGGSKFRFSSAAKYLLHEDAGDVDGTVAGYWGILRSRGLAGVNRFAAEKMKYRGAGPGFRGTQIACIAFNVKAHVAGDESNLCVWVSRSVVQ